MESDRDLPSEADVVAIGGSTDQAVAGMQEYIPAFAGCKVRERYTGSLMSTIDNLGVISSVSSIPGLYIGAGMLYGLTMSAGRGGGAGGHGHR